MAKSFLESIEEAMPNLSSKFRQGAHRKKLAKDLNEAGVFSDPVTSVGEATPYDYGDGEITPENLAAIAAEEDTDVPSVNYEDLVGVEAAKGMQAQMGGSVGDGDEGYRLTSGEEPESQADMVAEMGPKFDKSSLLDPTMDARQAGIPEETLATLFRKAHGGSFNPDSRTDRAKMATIRDMIQEDKTLLGLTPTKFAMRVYARR